MTVAADAHDARSGLDFGSTTRPADAHDARDVGHRAMTVAADAHAA